MAPRVVLLCWPVLAGSVGCAGEVAPSETAETPPETLCARVCEAAQKYCRLNPYEGCPALCEERFAPLFTDAQLRCMANVQSCTAFEACGWDAAVD
jgi:hypothetical protein